MFKSPAPFFKEEPLQQVPLFGKEGAGEVFPCGKRTVTNYVILNKYERQTFKSLTSFVAK